MITSTTPPAVDHPDQKTDLSYTFSVPAHQFSLLRKTLNRVR